MSGLPRRDHEVSLSAQEWLTLAGDTTSAASAQSDR